MHKAWDDEYVVFNDLTGDCHLLDAGGFTVLEYLQHNASATAITVMNVLAERFDDIDPADAGTLFQIEQTLAGLATCDLLEEIV